MILVYDYLADSSTKFLGLDGRSTVLKVAVAAIRDELKDRGFLDTDETGAIPRVSRLHFFRAKRLLLKRGDFCRKERPNMAPLKTAFPPLRVSLTFHFAFHRRFSETAARNNANWQ
jgi:hypothetical protein